MASHQADRNHWRSQPKRVTCYQRHVRNVFYCKKWLNFYSHQTRIHTGLRVRLGWYRWCNVCYTHKKNPISAPFVWRKFRWEYTSWVKWCNISVSSQDSVHISSAQLGPIAQNVSGGGVHGLHNKSTAFQQHACKWLRIDGLVQDCSISSALAMEILQICTKPSR